MSINTLSTKIEVTDIDSVVMTAISADPDTGMFIREFRCFGPLVDDVRPLIFTLRAVASDHDSLALTTPQLQV